MASWPGFKYRLREVILTFWAMELFPTQLGKETTGFEHCIGDIKKKPSSWVAAKYFIGDARRHFDLSWSGPHLTTSVDYIKNSAERVTTKFHWSSKGASKSNLCQGFFFPSVQVGEQERIESERKKGELEIKWNKIVGLQLGGRQWKPSYWKMRLDSPVWSKAY